MSRVPHKGLSREDNEAIRDAFDRLNRYYGWLYLLPPAASIEKIAGHLGTVRTGRGLARRRRPGGKPGEGR